MATAESHRLRMLAPRRTNPQFSTSQRASLHSQESNLWTLATRQARLGAALQPGLVEIVEKVGPCPARGEISVYYSTRITPDAKGAPTMRLVESLGHRDESVQSPLVRYAHGLFDIVEAAIDSADPLLSSAPGTVQRSMQRQIDGVRCIGFTTARRTSVIDMEFSVWIDAQVAHVVRIDFRGVNRREGADRERLSSIYGMRRFDLDQLGRRVLRSQTDRITFTTDTTDLPATGFAERTSAYSEHWLPPNEPPAA